MKKLCLNLMLLLAAVAAEAALTLLNNSAVDVTTNSATLRCTVTSTNGVAWTNVTYYGTINGGTTPTYWQFAATNAAPVLGTNSVAVTDLAPGTRYYFRSSAVDTSGVAWAATFGQFVTTALAPTSSPPAQLTTPLLVDTNGTIVAPANFATANSLADAGSLTAVADRVTGIEARSNTWNAAANTTINGQPLAGTNLVIESATYATSSGTSTNVAPILEWVATNNTTTVLNWAWPEDVTNVEFVASVTAFSADAIASETFVCYPTPAVATNYVQIRENIAGSLSQSAVTVSTTMGSTVLSLGVTSGTNGFNSSGRHAVKARFQRTPGGFHLAYYGFHGANHITNSTIAFERRHVNWFGGSPTNLSFSILSGSAFASNSWIRIVRE
jgi:hypothetical protein